MKWYIFVDAALWLFAASPQHNVTNSKFSPFTKGGNSQSQLIGTILDAQQGNNNVWNKWYLYVAVVLWLKHGISVMLAMEKIQNSPNEVRGFSKLIV